MDLSPSTNDTNARYDRSHYDLHPDLLEQHYEELQFLWGRRQSALRSPTVTIRAFSALEERIEGHVQGLLVAQDRMIALLEEGLAADQSATAFAATYPLLRLGTDKARSLVLNALGSAAGVAGEGIRLALCQSPADAVLPALQTFFFLPRCPRPPRRGGPGVSRTPSPGNEADPATPPG